MPRGTSKGISSNLIPCQNRPATLFEKRTNNEHAESGTSVLHVWDIHISKGRTPGRRNGGVAQTAGGLVRGFCRNGCRCCSGGLRSVASCQRIRPRSVDSGSAVASGNRATTYFWSGYRASRATSGYRAARRCADRGRRGAALQGAFGGCGRDMGRPASPEFYSNETSGASGRGHGGALLANPARRNPQSERGAGPLADYLPALSAGSRRCQSPRRPALAAGAVSLARQAARDMGGAA